jgi:hypothetical protein
LLEHACRAKSAILGTSKPGIGTQPLPVITHTLTLLAFPTTSKNRFS